MNYQTKIMYRKTGIFVFSALLVLLILLGSIIIKQKIFVRRQYYYTVLDNLYGLDESVAVVFKGHEIGRVQKYSFNSENNIEVRFFIYNDYIDRILEGSVISKNVHPLTGKGTLEFFMGYSGGKSIDENSIIPSLDMEEGRRIYAERRIRQSGDPIAMIISELSLFLVNLNSDDNYDHGSFFRMLFHLADSMENFNKTLVSLNIIMDSIDGGDNSQESIFMGLFSSLDNLFKDFQVTNSLLAANLLELNKVLVNYGEPEGLLLKMIDPTEELLIKPINESISLLNDNLKELQLLLGFMQNHTPEMALIMYESIKSLGDLQRTLQGINNNPLIRRGIKQDLLPVPGERIRPLDR